MPGRSYSAGNQYRYGFNGKENDNEVKGEGNQQDYGMRIYDPRLGRFLSVDPISSEFPWNSVFSYAENDPINYTDLDGLERGPNTSQSGGRGTGSQRSGGGLILNHPTNQARILQQHLRQNRIVQQREDLARHNRSMAINPLYRASTNWLRNSLQKFRTHVYWQNAFESAGIALSGGNVRDNNRIGSAWDNLVHTSMLNNPNYIGVARQVSLKITGMVNGEMTVAKIRMDNVGIKTDPVTGKVLFDFKEAKYSIEQITINNVIQTLTPQQKNAANILINGTDVQVFLRGNGSTGAMNAAMHSSGQSVSSPIFRSTQN